MFFVGDEFQSIYGFRHADVAVFRERRERGGRRARARPQLPLAARGARGGERRSSAAEFGDEFQPLAASGEFPDPVFGHPVELLVTDKCDVRATATRTGAAARRATIARRVRELVDAGQRDARRDRPPVRGRDRRGAVRGGAPPRRPADLPRAPAAATSASSRSSTCSRTCGCSTTATTTRRSPTVLASPFVGVSNDALVLLRRAARAPAALRRARARAAAEALDGRRRRLVRAFLQRYERLVRRCGAALARAALRARSSPSTTTTSPCSRGGTAAAATRTCASSPGSRARTRSCAGPTSRVRPLRARAGGRRRGELEAVAEEEGADAVRLLTIHAAKGLEFKVVVVADAGRDRAPPALGRDPRAVGRPLRLPRRRPRDERAARAPFAYDEVREARRQEEAAERLRLYYVAMTRAVDRLIVSGAIDPGSTADASTPIGWVLGRLDCAEDAGGLGRGAGRARPRRRAPAPARRPVPARARRAGGGARPGGAAVPVRRGRRRRAAAACADPARARDDPGAAAAPPPPALVHRRSRPSSAARTSTTPSAYVAGMRGAASRPRPAGGDARSAATDLGSIVHELLERDDARPADPSVTAGGRGADHAASSQAWHDSELGGRVAALEGVEREAHFTFEHDGVLVHGFIDLLHRSGRPRARRRLQDERARRPRAGRGGGARVPAPAPRLRPRVLPRRRRGGRGRVRVPRAAGGAGRGDVPP